MDVFISGYNGYGGCGGGGREPARSLPGMFVFGVNNTK